MGESTRAEAEAAGYEAGTQQAISLVDPLMSTRHLEMCTRKAASQWPRRAIGHMWESQSGSDAVGPWAGAGPSHTGSVAKRIKIKISTRPRAVVTLHNGHRCERRHQNGGKHLPRLTHKSANYHSQRRHRGGVLAVRGRRQLPSSRGPPVKGVPLRLAGAGSQAQLPPSLLKGVPLRFRFDDPTIFRAPLL